MAQQWECGSLLADFYFTMMIYKEENQIGIFSLTDVLLYKRNREAPFTCSWTTHFLLVERALLAYL